MEALRTYTLNSATAMFREHELGSIEVGKRADLVVLSHDPTLADPTYIQIQETVVQRTYVDGVLEYSVWSPVAPDMDASSGRNCRYQRRIAWTGPSSRDSSGRGR